VIGTLQLAKGKQGKGNEGLEGARRKEEGGVFVDVVVVV